MMNIIKTDTLKSADIFLTRFIKAAADHRRRNSRTMPLANHLEIKGKE